MTTSWRVRSETTDSSNTTRALCVAKLTVASRTPLSFLSVRSLRAEQEAQCIPAMLNVAVFMDSFPIMLSRWVGRRRLLAPISRGLALPSRRLDLLLQGLEPDGADQDLGPDHVARRAGEADGLGKLEVLFDRRLYFRALHVALKPRHVEADFLGHRERTHTVGPAAPAEQFLVEFEIFPSALVLHAHGGRDSRGLDRSVP